MFKTKMMSVAVATLLTTCGGVAHAQAIIKQSQVTVVSSDCVKDKKGSVSGATAGAAIGAGVASLVTKSPLGWAASGLLGAAIGNSAGGHVNYSCNVVVTDQKEQFLTQYVGTNEPFVGQIRVLNALSTGQGVLQ